MVTWSCGIWGWVGFGWGGSRWEVVTNVLTFFIMLSCLLWVKTVNSKKALKTALTDRLYVNNMAEPCDTDQLVWIRFVYITIRKKKMHFSYLISHARCLLTKCWPPLRRRKYIHNLLNANQCLQNLVLTEWCSCICRCIHCTESTLSSHCNTFLEKEQFPCSKCKNRRNRRYRHSQKEEKVQTLPYLYVSVHLSPVMQIV